MSFLGSVARLAAFAFLFSSFASATPKQPEGPETVRLLKRAYSPRVNPATEIPRFPEYSTWKVTSAVMGETDATKPIPVYDIQGIDLVQIGEIPSGTEITLGEVATHSGRNFYRYPLSAANGKGSPRNGWVDGLYIVRDDANSWKP